MSFQKNIGVMSKIKLKKTGHNGYQCSLGNYPYTVEIKFESIV